MKVYVCSRLLCLPLLIALFFPFSSTAKAAAIGNAEAEATTLLPGDNDLLLLAGTSRVMNVPSVERVQVANPKIADVVIPSENEVIINGVAPGITTLHTWSRGKLSTLNVKVVSDMSTGLSDLTRILNDPAISVTPLQNNILVLSGAVSSPIRKERALNLARVFSNQVIDLISVAANDTTQEISAAIGDPRIQVRLFGDTIILEGLVNRESDRVRAEKIARALSPQVENLVQVTPVQANQIQVIRGTNVVTLSAAPAQTDQ